MTAGEFNKIVELYADGVYRFILKNLKNEDKSKDIVQDSFEKLWIKSGEVSFEKARTYLFSTAYHTMIDNLRREKHAINYLASKDIGHADPSESFDLPEILNKALEKLPEIQRSVLLLRDYEGYSYQEISGICDLTESQVKVYIYRARMAMQKYLVTPELIV
ncbi:MAG: RNA polymerase sigma factor [Bacteroidetes bacterium]|nr:RNA polymerase sigma factor [Bacteroidota bacterium]